MCSQRAGRPLRLPSNCTCCAGTPTTLSSCPVSRRHRLRLNFRSALCRMVRHFRRRGIHPCPGKALHRGSRQTRADRHPPSARSRCLGWASRARGPSAASRCCVATGTCLSRRRNREEHPSPPYWNSGTSNPRHCSYRRKPCRWPLPGCHTSPNPGQPTSGYSRRRQCPTRWEWTSRRVRCYGRASRPTAASLSRRPSCPRCASTLRTSGQPPIWAQCPSRAPTRRRWPAHSVGMRSERGTGRKVRARSS